MSPWISFAGNFGVVDVSVFARHLKIIFTTKTCVIVSRTSHSYVKLLEKQTAWCHFSVSHSSHFEMLQSRSTTPGTCNSYDMFYIFFSMWKFFSILSRNKATHGVPYQSHLLISVLINLFYLPIHVMCQFSNRCVGICG